MLASSPFPSLPINGCSNLSSLLTRIRRTREETTYFSHHSSVSFKSQKYIAKSVVAFFDVSLVTPKAEAWWVAENWVV